VDKFHDLVSGAIDSKVDSDETKANGAALGCDAIGDLDEVKVAWPLGGCGSGPRSKVP
jgi:hypothetical protein